MRKPNFPKEWWRYAILGVGVICVVAALTISQINDTSKLQWDVEGLRNGERVSFTEIRDMMRAAEKTDRIAIFNGDIVLEKRSAEIVELDERIKAWRADADDNAKMPDEISIDLAAADRDLYTADSPVSLVMTNEGELGTQAELHYSSLPGKISAKSILDIVLFLAIIGLFGFMIKMQLGNGGGGHEFVRAKDLKQGLNDVAGMRTARKEAKEMIDLIQAEGKIGKIGARPPKGLLLAGPPGTGKTLLARAMARDSGLNFISLDASGLHQMFVGVGPARLRAAFRKARAHAPCIVFIDEIDAIGARGTGAGSVDRERDNLINALLVQMDGLTSTGGIFVVAATNRPDQIDPAIVRPGRIDRQITIGLPNVEDREAILRLHTKELPISAAVDFARIAQSTPGMSGADLAAMCNEAGIAAGREDLPEIAAQHFAAARQRMLLGQTGSVTALSPQEAMIVAAHEAGHAVAAMVLENTDPIEHATILPSGASLGHVLQLPDQERHLETRARMIDRMTVLAAGRVAEELCFGKAFTTNGAASDIQALTRIAESMVLQWGMSDFGFQRYDPAIGVALPPKAQSEVSRLARAAVASAHELLLTHGGLHSALMNKLLEVETLHFKEMLEIKEQVAIREIGQKSTHFQESDADAELAAP